MCAEGKVTEKKKNETNFFFLFATEVLNSTSFIYIYIYVRSSYRARKLKKSRKKRRIVFNENTTRFFPLCMCVRLLHSQSFFSVCVRAFGVCKYINASESRQIEKREKRRRRKNWGRKRMGNTRTLLCFLDVDSSVKEEERKGTEPKRKSKTEMWGSQLSEKIISQKGKRNKVVWKCV